MFLHIPNEFFERRPFFGGLLGLAGMGLGLFGT